MQIKKPRIEPLIKKKIWDKSEANNYKSQIPSGKFSESYIRSLKFRAVNGKRVPLGQGTFGKVYLGDLKFQDGSKQRVAIKLYKKIIPETMDRQILQEYKRYQQETLKKYKEVISDLSTVKIPAGLFENKSQPLIPKCAVFLIDGQMVFVSQAFTRKENKKQVSKFTKRTEISEIYDTQKFKEIIYSSLVLISKGYNPEIDIFMKYKDRNTFMILDFDGFVQRPKLKESEYMIAFNNVLLEIFSRAKKPQKREILSFVETVIRQDKGNMNSDFKYEILELLNNIKI
jgi:hypothetical protein